tara:strand:+ start:9319 stop:9519 length:201 start_codon:yes stop_codon:yes gene_type:complete
MTAKENSQRINKIETDVKMIQKDISVIKTNHLKHIEDDVRKMDTRLWAILLLLVASMFIPFVKGLW